MLDRKVPCVLRGKVPRARGGIDIRTFSRMVLAGKSRVFVAGSKSRAWTMKTEQRRVGESSASIRERVQAACDQIQSVHLAEALHTVPVLFGNIARS